MSKVREQYDHTTDLPPIEADPKSQRQSSLKSSLFPKIRVVVSLVEVRILLKPSMDSNDFAYY
jgi:hypothetical protein